jgi:membrane fusion protein (multidrug efflux system)
VTFNPYGEIVYVVRESGKDKKGKTILIAKQAFVVTGETRGDQVTILKGLEEGETIVTSGQLKLKNGSEVVINNSVVPENNPAPNPPNER